MTSPCHHRLGNFTLAGLAGWLATVLVLGWVAWPVGATQPADAAAKPVQVVEADFQALPDWGANADAAGPARHVALPDAWRTRGRVMPPAAVYRLTLPGVAGPPATMQALRFTHVSSQVEMHLNGQLLYERGADLAGAHAIRTLPLLVPVPPALLVPGPNRLALRVAHGQWQRAGLAGVQFGALSQLAGEHQRHLWWRVDGPQRVNLLGVAVSAVLLLMWWFRRNEVALGLFGAVFLLTSLRNYGYDAELVAQGAFTALASDWLQFGSVLWSGVLLLLFSWRHAEVVHPRVERALVWGAWAATALGALVVAVQPADLLRLRLLVYPLTGTLTVLAAAVAVRCAWRSRRAADAWLALGFALIVLGALHDFVYLTGRLSLEDSYWMPYLTPVLLGVFSVQLVGRMLLAMRTAEDLSLVLEQRVAQRTRELAVANEAKTRFIAVASHDLRQPLNAVGLLVGTLRERIRFPEVRSLVDKIQSSVDGMAALLQSLLDLSRLEGHGAPARREDVPLAGLLQALRPGLEPLALQRGLRLRFARTQLVVRTDPALLAGMLRNLVGNAIRYTPRGTVLVGVRRQGGTACLQVIDTGVGIALAEQAQVFDEFYRGSAAGAADSPGAGLGLAIVKRSADLLGHALSMRSVPGRGTLMQIELPIVPIDLAGSVNLFPPGAEADRQRIAGSFVVVVEDDPTAREALGQLLHHWGCHVLLAASAAQAQADLQGHLRGPDLLLCDFHLGGGPDGLQTIDLLRQAAGEPVPALLMTAEVSAAQRAVTGWPEVPVLVKPVAPGVLASAMAAVLAGPPGDGPARA